MKSRTTLLAAAAVAASFVVSALDAQAGDSRPEPRAYAVTSTSKTKTVSVYQDCPFVPRPYNHCRPTPIEVFRYGSKKGVESACTYGYPGERGVVFHGQYPTSRGGR